MRKREQTQQKLWAELCVFLKPSASETKEFLWAVPNPQQTQREKKPWESLNVLSHTFQDKCNSMVMCPKKVLAHRKPQWKQIRHHPTFLFCEQLRIDGTYWQNQHGFYLAQIKWKTRWWQAAGEQVPVELVLMGIPHLAVRQIFIRIWINFPHFAHPARETKPLLLFTSLLSSKNSLLVAKKSENYRAQHHSSLPVWWDARSVARGTRREIIFLPLSNASLLSLKRKEQQQTKKPNQEKKNQHKTNEEPTLYPTYY